MLIMLMPKETPESWRVDNIEALLRLLICGFRYLGVLVRCALSDLSIWTMLTLCKGLIFAKLELNLILN